MFPTQNAEVLPRYNTNSPIYSQYTEEKSYVKEYLNSIAQIKFSKLSKILERNSRCFDKSFLNQWRNLVNRYFEIFDDSQSSNVLLKNRILTSIFEFNRQIEIRNIDLYYIFHSLKLVEENKAYISNLSPEAVLASIFKSSLTYSKEAIQSPPTFCGDLEKTIMECFNVSAKDLAICESVITSKNVSKTCANMKYQDYTTHSKYLCKNVDDEDMIESDIAKELCTKSLNTIPYFTAQEMAYVKRSDPSSKMFSEPCQLKEVFSFIDDILNSSKISENFKKDYKFLLFTRFIKLDEFFKFKSVEINSARIYLERIMKIDKNFENKNPSMMFISLLGISVSRARNFKEDKCREKLAYFADVKDTNLLKETSDNIIDTFGFRSRSSLDISYLEYLNYLKSHY